jgi:hypothetical protein
LPNHHPSQLYSQGGIIDDAGGFVAGIRGRHDQDDPITAALTSVASEFGWDRFAVRLSNAPGESRSTLVVEHPGLKPTDATLCLCRQQIDQKETCSACALCWEGEKRIAFMQH